MSQEEMSRSCGRPVHLALATGNSLPVPAGQTLRGGANIHLHMLQVSAKDTCPLRKCMNQHAVE